MAPPLVPDDVDTGVTCVVSHNIDIDKQVDGLVENNTGTSEFFSNLGMMTSWHGNAFCIAGPLWGKSNTVEQIVELSVISGAMWCHCNSDLDLCMETVAVDN